MIQLMHGDCLELMKDIPDQSVDVALIDPPYTMTKRGKSCRPNWMPHSMGDTVFDTPLIAPEVWMTEVYRSLKPDSHFYTFTNNNDILPYLNAAKSVGFKMHNILTMVKDTGMPNRWYYLQCERVLFFRKGTAKPINDYTSRDWEKVIMPKNSTGKLHITQKPLEFIQRLVTNSSRQGDVVLDCFMGSGTTGVACVNTKRNFIGIEKDPDYFKICQQRIKEAEEKKDMEEVYNLFNEPSDSQVGA